MCFMEVCSFISNLSHILYGHSFGFTTLGLLDISEMNDCIFDYSENMQTTK